MRISPNYTSEHWQKLPFPAEDAWPQAVDIFEDRIQGRFLKFISLIEKDTFAGFVVMALDCLLIETLQQFREGVAETPKGKSKDYFVAFLTETSFKKWFTKDKAEKFYKQIRCGILHRAETKKSSLIRTDTPLVEYTENKVGLVINRRLFHQQLEQEFKTYISKLRDPSQQELRDKFKKKMDYICRVCGEID